ncbi:MAG: glycosyltransferase [Chloroflexi bacterium]|nr:glycosyltransferase [Chloroflexota bacterium]
MITRARLARVAAVPLTMIGGIFTVPLLLALAVWLVAVSFLASRRRTSGEPSSAPRNDCASILVLNWNGKNLLEECLPSVVDAARRGAHEVIVVDNGSSDGSTAFVRERFPEVRVLALEKNLGFGEGCNAGVRAATHDVVVLLNNDMRIEPGAIKALLEPFTSEQVFAVTAQIYFWDPTRRREETGQTVGGFRAGRLFVAHENPGSAVRPILYAGGGSSAFDRRKFLALGGFDPLFKPFYGEDTDLSYRAWRRGWSALFQPEAVVYHKHRGTVAKHFSPDYISATVERNHLLFIWANVSDWRILFAQALAWPLHVLNRSKNGEPIWRPLFGAMSRLGGVLGHIWNEGSSRSVSDRDVVKLANDPLHFKEMRLASPIITDGEPLNILVLSPYFPYPPAHGGAVRVYSLIKYLSDRHRVTLVSFIDKEEERANIPEMMRLCQEVHVFLRRPQMWRYSPLELTPLGVREFEDTAFKQKVRELLASQDYHVLQIDYTQMAQYVEPSRHYVTLLTEHDLSFLSLYRRFAAAPWGIDKILSLVACMKMLHFELRVCQKFDTVLTVTEREAKMLRRLLPLTHVSSAAPTGVDTAHYHPANKACRSRRLLFVGYLQHRPNVEALLFFCRKIYPMIKEQVPEVRLTVAGKGASAAVLELSADPSIDLMGFVPDLRPCYQSHAAFVAPITTGAGVRVKILEAMAAGIPVIATSLGAEGIECEPGRDLLIADDPAEFAARAVRLLSDEHLGITMANRARVVVETNYDWRIIARNFEAVCREGLSNKRKVYEPADKVEIAT